MGDQVLAELIDLVESQEISDKLKPEAEKLLQWLADHPEEPQAWQPLPEGFFATRLPDEVESAWLFALRSGGVFGNERHPNSWQRSIALKGVAEFDLLADGKWEKHEISGARSNDRRAVSIPPNVWHRIKIGEQTLVSLSFHTARANELIEETSECDDLTTTKRRLYQA